MNNILQIEQIGSFLAVVIMFVLILYGSYYCSKKVAKISMRENQTTYMKLVDRMMLGQDKYIAIILVGEKYYMIGTSANEISLLTELDETSLVEFESQQNPFSSALNFKEIMKKLGKDKDPSI